MVAEEPVVVVPYDPVWPEIFERERASLGAAIHDPDLSIVHIGSTSVPGLTAKPVIDILIEAPALPTPRPPSWTSEESWRAIEFAKALAVNNYLPTYDDGGRAVFEKAEPRINLLVFLTGDNRAKGLVLFRDYLREHPSHAQEYETLKEGLAREHRNDSAAYTMAKLAFVNRTLELARAGRE